MATESNKRYTLTQPQGEFLKSYLLRYIDADVQDDGDTDEVVEEVYEEFVKHFRISKPDEMKIKNVRYAGVCCARPSQNLITGFGTLVYLQDSACPQED